MIAVRNEIARSASWTVLAKPTTLALGVAAYLTMVLAIVVSLWMYRSRALTSFDTAASQRDWQAWREAATESGLRGGVKRSRPTSVEPPALVMMRDHFGVCLTIAVVLATALYVTLAIVLRGVIRGSDAHR